MAAFESQKRAIPLKTAVFACARASQYGVTIKRDGHICRSSPHEAGGGTRTQVLTEFLGERQVSKAENSQHTPEGVYMPCLVAGDGGGKINIEGLRMAGRSPAASLKDIWLRGNAKELSILWKDTSSRIFVSGKTKTKEDSSA